MLFEFAKEKGSIIKVIGVGGGGSNAVNHMFKQGIKGVDFMVCNTDAQALDISPVPNKIQLGPSLTEGRGAGSIPEVGKNAAIENLDEVRRILENNTKMVFITAGMGGGTGTGAAPIIAKLAREMGILTVGIVTVPFTFEGKKRKNQANDGLEELKENVDTLLIICNDKLRDMYGNLTLTQAFGKADDILTVAAKGIAEIITVTGYINVDFEDVKTVMKDSGVAIMGAAVAEGEDRAINAIEMALSSPLLNDTNIHGARHILLNVASGTNEVRMDEIDSITDFIQREAGLTAELIWGNCIDETLGDKISVTIIATGFKTAEELGNIKPELKKTVHTLDNKVQAKPEAVPALENKVEPQVEDSNEPRLIKREEKTETPVVEFVIKPKSEDRPVFESLSVNDNFRKPMEKEIHEMESRIADDLALERSNERRMKLKGLSLKLSNLNDLEKEPAYKRKNVKLDTVTPSSQSSISRYTLGPDANGNINLNENNSYLHDNVD